MNKFTEKLVSRKIQIINVGVLLFCTVISAISSLIPPIDTYFKNNNIYVAICYVLATTIGLMVYSIFEYIHNVKPLDKSYRPVKELGKLLNRLDDDLTVNVYFGLDDIDLLDQLIFFLNTHTTISKQYHIYMRSCLIKQIRDENYFNEFNFYLSCNLPELILIHTNPQNNDSAKSYFIRCSENNALEYIAIDSENDIIHTLSKNLFTHINSIYLSDPFISKAMPYIFDTNCSSLNNLISNKCLVVRGRDAFFKYMTDILKNFNSNVYAIDFILPRFWLEHNYTKEYGLAHKNIMGIKQRIHIIDIERIKTLNRQDKANEIEVYKNYAEFMKKDCNVQLYFLELSEFDSIKYEKRGSLILSKECVFVAINPSDGAPLGEIDFNVEKIESYMNRFDDCMKKAQAADDYIKNILTKI